MSPPVPAAAHGKTIAALGRLEPKGGVTVVAGPSQTATFVNVIAELRVKEGHRVAAGDVIALFDTYRTREASLNRARAQIEYVDRELGRFERLRREGVVSASELDVWKNKRAGARAEVEQAQAEFDLSHVHAPISGEVLKVHAYPGERVERDGILELGNTDEMYAVAEVYENDVRHVKAGHRASVTSPAFAGEIQGTVERIGSLVGKKDVLETDPAAKTDARVVEVKIRLDDSRKLAGLTNLQVDVRIVP